MGDQNKRLFRGKTVARELLLLMHDVYDRAPPQQTLVPSVLADVGAALPRGLIAHLITNRIPEVLGDVELVGRSSRRSPTVSRSCCPGCG